MTLTIVSTVVCVITGAVDSSSSWLSQHTEGDWQWVHTVSDVFCLWTAAR